MNTNDGFKEIVKSLSSELEISEIQFSYDEDLDLRYAKCANSNWQLSMIISASIEQEAIETLEQNWPEVLLGKMIILAGYIKPRMIYISIKNKDYNLIQNTILWLNENLENCKITVCFED